MRLLKKSLLINFALQHLINQGCEFTIQQKNGFSAATHAVHTIVLSKNCIFTITDILFYMSIAYLISFINLLFL